MELSAAQQERYSRHLLLDGFGGEGQERLCAARVQVRGSGPAALWAARYLAASGAGSLIVDTEEIAIECRGLNGDASVSIGGNAELVVDLREGSAFDGAGAALALLHELGAQP